MASLDTLRTKQVVTDILQGRPGDANFEFLTDGHGQSGFTESFGGLQDFWDKNPDTGEFVRLTPGREAPDRIETSLVAKVRTGMALRDRRHYEQCPSVLRVRDFCGRGSDINNYVLLQYLVDAYATNREHSDPQSTIDGTDQERTMTMNFSASYYEVVRKVQGLSIALTGLETGYNDVAINDVVYCDALECGSCGSGISDGCNTAFAVTDEDAAPYANPYLLLTEDGGATWEARVITVLSGAAVKVTCAGDRVLVVGQADGGVAYATKAGNYDDWVLEDADFFDAPTDIWAVDAATIYAPATGGAIYKSSDGGVSWTRVLDPGTLATADLTEIVFVDSTLGYAGGLNGEILKFSNGVWSQLVDPTGGANITCIALQPGRGEVVVIGTSDGNIWRSRDEGENWIQIRFPGDGAGSVDDLQFAGALGVVMYIMHQNAAGFSRILRDLDGGAGLPGVEVVTTYTNPPNNAYNAFAFCEPNEGLAVGELVGVVSAVVKVQ